VGVGGGGCLISLKERDQFEDIGIDERILLKLDISYTLETAILTLLL
jgi:hypothetical protein